MRHRKALSVVFVVVVGAVAWLASGSSAPAKTAKESDPGSGSRIRKGFAIAPVPLNLEGKNRAMVGMGSYLVNSVGGCNDCHSCPSYAPGHNPYGDAGDGQINGANYLAGGVAFGPFVSANLTPDASGNPAGLTLAEFIRTIRTGHDQHDGHPLFVMPWPIFRNMNDRDLASIYEYLSSIPHAEPGTCGGAGE
jgi:hypothetical protein